MSNKKQIGAHLDTESLVWEDFQRYMDRHGLETYSDAMRMAIIDACQPYRAHRKVARTMIYYIFMLGIGYGGSLFLLMFIPQNQLLAQISYASGMTIIVIFALLPPVVYPMAKHRKEQRGQGYLEQLRMALAVTISSGPQVPE